MVNARTAIRFMQPTSSKESSSGSPLVEKYFMEELAFTLLGRATFLRLLRSESLNEHLKKSATCQQ
jgi:hypothetical protein